MFPVNNNFSVYYWYVYSVRTTLIGKSNLLTDTVSILYLSISNAKDLHSSGFNLFWNTKINIICKVAIVISKVTYEICDLPNILIFALL